MAKIIAPNKAYNGLSANVRFCNGVGETDNPNLIEWFKEHGYQVEGDEPVESDNGTSEPAPGGTEGVEHEPESKKTGRKKAGE